MHLTRQKRRCRQSTEKPLAQEPENNIYSRETASRFSLDELLLWLGAKTAQSDAVLSPWTALEGLSSIDGTPKATDLEPTPATILMKSYIDLMKPYVTFRRSQSTTLPSATVPTCRGETPRPLTPPTSLPNECRMPRGCRAKRSQSPDTWGVILHVIRQFSFPFNVMAPESLV